MNDKEMETLNKVLHSHKAAISLINDNVNELEKQLKPVLLNIKRILETHTEAISLLQEELKWMKLNISK